MTKRNLPAIKLDKEYNIISVDENLKERYPYFFRQGTLKSMLSAYSDEELSQPVLLSVPGSPVRLLVVLDENEIICQPVQDRNYLDGKGLSSFHLRENLTGIFSMLPVLVDNIHKADDDRAIENLEFISLQSYKMLKSITNLILSSKATDGSEITTQAINLSRLVESVAYSTNAVERSVHFNLDIEKDVNIEANNEYMTNGLLCLVANSINYAVDDNVEINIKLKAENNRCVLTYSDNSKGIKDEYQTMVFRPYFSMDPYGEEKSNPSLGLGLFITKTAIEQAGGNILLSSSFGKGVRYNISLPLYEGNEMVLKTDSYEFLLNRYSPLFIQLCDSCRLPDMK